MSTEMIELPTLKAVETPDKVRSSLAEQVEALCAEHTRLQEQHNLLIRRCAQAEGKARECEAKLKDYEIRFANAMTALNAGAIP